MGDTIQYFKGFEVVKAHKSLRGNPDEQFVALASIAINMLCLRIVQLVKPMSDLFQVLGLLSQIGKLGLFHLIEESLWLSIFIACKKTGGYIMRRISCVLFEVLLATGVSLDAVCYGQYVQSMASVNCNMNISNLTGSVLDAHLYLEEMGYTWYIHQIAMLQLGRLQACRGWTHDGSGTAAAAQALSSDALKKERRGSDQRLKRVSFDAPELIARSISLFKKSGLLSVLSPRASVPCSYFPFYYFTLKQTTEFISITNELQDRLEDILNQAAPKDFEKSDHEVARTPLDVKRQPLNKKSWSFSFFGSSRRQPPHQQSIVKSVEDDVRSMYISELPDQSDSRPIVRTTMDVAALQTKICNYMEELSAVRNAVTCIHNQTPCPGCGLSLLDEEIMPYWSYTFMSIEPKKLLSSEDYFAAHRVVCPSCSTAYNSKLTIQYCTKPETNGAQSVGLKPKILWIGTVDYLSPSAVGVLFDRLIFYEGDAANSREWLCKNCPELYWNMVWYCTRFGFPTGFRDSPASDLVAIDAKSGYCAIDAPIVTSWRSCVCERVAMKCLSHCTVSEITLMDLIPDSMRPDLEEYLARLTNLKEYLNGSADGMKECILIVFPDHVHNKILCSNPNDTPARLTYFTLLILYHLYECHLTQEPMHYAYRALDTV